jgi:hypothetical protein
VQHAADLFRPLYDQVAARTASLAMRCRRSSPPTPRAPTRKRKNSGSASTAPT